MFEKFDGICPECRKEGFTHPKGLGAHRSIKHGVVGTRRVATSLLRGGPNYAAPRVTTGQDFAAVIMVELARLRDEKLKLEGKIERLRALVE